ncbi:glyoxylate/hydroxypyruvate reductase A [Maribacter vaceletii]|uniref:Glyoxylate/hydroxypyruvate reductase A n=1 Tax=Maribacter vaceletii TaxID=1206816 RepID=A0A495E9B2_9FLAO|nr:glyoxylate/hydroxypyruvate reductase A [Maribacter vaceletii]RKR12397.1 glyoxylate/hydroxypyruvate reductase A [Maribacter vaceletii]
MSILLIFENKNPDPWHKQLIEKLPEETIEVYPEVKDASLVDFILCWKPKKDVFNTFPNVKVVQSVGASIDHITNSQTLPPNTVVTRIVDTKLTQDMWEFLAAVVLGELKNTSLYLSQQKEKKWEQHGYASFKNVTVTILGLGSIGGYVAQNFSSLGFKVKGWGNSKKQLSGVTSFHGKDEFKNCLQDTNFLINLLPLTKETRDILNANTLESIATNAFLINVGRGEHLVEEDLLQLVNSSKLSGALLDVFREEPLPEKHPFWEHKKIKITPHIASLTSIESAAEQVIENYQNFLNKKALVNVVSLKKGY